MALLGLLPVALLDGCIGGVRVVDSTTGKPVDSAWVAYRKELYRISLGHSSENTRCAQMSVAQTGLDGRARPPIGASIRSPELYIVYKPGYHVYKTNEGEDQVALEPFLGTPGDRVIELSRAAFDLTCANTDAGQTDGLSKAMAAEGATLAAALPADSYGRSPAIELCRHTCWAHEFIPSRSSSESDRLCADWLEVNVPACIVEMTRPVRTELTACAKYSDGRSECTKLWRVRVCDKYGEHCKEASEPRSDPK